MQVKDLLVHTARTLKQAGLPEPRRITEWIFCDVLDCSPAQLMVCDDVQIEQKNTEEILAAAARCAVHEPVQYVTGSTEFHGLLLHLSPEVLIPRPETEQLVEMVLETVTSDQPIRVLDIGTGSGCIALAVKQACPNAQVTACDISAGALRIARKNADRYGLQIQMIQVDLFAHDFIGKVGTGYDLVIANPPYIPDSERSALPRMVRDYEPEIALFCGDDPLKFYRMITKHLDNGLLEGILALEAHSDYTELAGSLLRRQGGLDVHIKRDLAGLPRFILGEYVRA